MVKLSAPDLHREVDKCMRVDQHALRRQIKSLVNAPPGDGTEHLTRWQARLHASQALRTARKDVVPEPTWPDLPIVEHRDAIKSALQANQVVIVCGETGSGKTTQLPKMCLELGRGQAGYIGHTQPRRIAARSVAARLAEELNTQVGELVGFKIRFSDQVSDASLIKLMTDGILLAEIQKDPLLTQYDTIIIDEAHERSLNIDFLLGYIKQLLPKRRDLKVIITSATIDPERFAEHFDNAPIIMAQGRTYPVEVRYAPLEDNSESIEDSDMSLAVVDACESLLQENQHDILVFMTGERDIREQVDVFSRHASTSRWLRGVEVIPLYSRLSNAEQNRVFQSHSRARIVLATNVAETSLTVPGIRSVVDTGMARMSRYSVRSKVQRLPIERISQASANQRMGRCGRLAPGICIRLYSEEDFDTRAEFTEPEILRTNLSSVILQMATLNLGAIDAFPFIEPPDSKFINDGYRNLQELSALDEKRKLTPLGRRLARLPIDPRLARMLVAGADEGAVREVLTIVSALSVQDPRERPFEKRGAADEQHAEFNHESSDFMAWLNLWAFVTVQKKQLSNSQFRKMCKQRFLSPMRVQEWIEVRRQLATVCKELKLPLNSNEASYDNIHRALLTGLLGNVAMKTDKHDYLGTRNRHLKIFPGSGLFKKGPKWMMSAEIAETSQLFARQVASVDVDWIERLADHLLKRTYRDAHWQKRSGTVGALEQSTLYGLVINPKKRVNYSPINPSESREIFIRDALVGGALQTQGDFHRHNLALIEEVTTLEDKSRRRDIVVDPEELVRFYDAVIPEDINTAKSFETFRKTYEQDQPRGLYYTRDQLLRDDEVEVSERDFPNQLDLGGMVLPLRYHFAPGEVDDGVTLMCPVDVLNRVPPALPDWLVPGMLEEKITLLIKGLPKAVRRNFVPAPDFAHAAVNAMTHGQGVLTQELSAHLKRMTGMPVPSTEWDASGLPDHLRMRFEVIDNEGKRIDSGRDLTTLQETWLDHVEESLLKFSDNSIEQDQVLDWNFGDLPDAVDIEKAGITMQGYPALQATDEGVALKLFATPGAAKQSMPVGLRALYRQSLKDEIRYLQRKLPAINVLCLRFAPFGTKKQLTDDIINAALDHVFIQDKPLPRTRDAWLASMEAGRPQLVPVAGEICGVLERVFEAHRQVAKRIEGSVSLSWIEAVKDIKEQISSLLFVGFVTATGLPRLARLPVYFDAMHRRVLAIDQAPDKDRRRRSEFSPVWLDFQNLPSERADDPDFHELWLSIRWAFEELRISLFAQELGTQEKVSVSRMENRVAELRAR